MRLFHDLWATSRCRTMTVLCLVVLTSVASSAAAALSGPLLLHRSGAVFAMLAGCLVTLTVGNLGTSLILADLVSDWCSDLRGQLCRMAMGQDLHRLENTPVGEFLDRIDGDVQQLATALRTYGVNGLRSLCLCGVSVLATFLLWWPAGICALVTCCALFASIARPLNAIATARAKEEEAWSDLAAVAEEAVHGQDDMRACSARPWVLHVFARAGAGVLDRARRVWFLAACVVTTSVALLRFLLVLLVLAGIWALGSQRADAARLTSIWLLMMSFTLAVEHISRVLPELQTALGAWERVRGLAESPQEPSGGLPCSQGDLTIQGLTFHYPHEDSQQSPASTDAPQPQAAPSDDPVREAALRDITLTFVQGRSYALVGRTGSGKSTLAKILTRAVEVPPGTVHLNGTDLTDLDLEDLRRWVGIVPQHTEILAGTLAENITLFDSDLLPAVEPTLRDLDLQAWVNDLPDGLHTRLGADGHTLSAGQEQLIAFARLLVRDPGIVILDEATARMDPVTERKVHQAAGRLLHGRIGIVIAHRPTTVEQCDDVVVLAEGRVIETGPMGSVRAFSRTVPVLHHEQGAQEPQGKGALALQERFERLGGDTAGGTMPDATSDVTPDVVVPARRAQPAVLPPPPRSRPLVELLRLTRNNARFSYGSTAVFFLIMLTATDGSLLPWLWADLVDGSDGTLWPAAALAAALLLPIPLYYWAQSWFSQWWVRQMLRINVRLVHGQTGPRRTSSHTPAEVVAQGHDAERVVDLAEHLLDLVVCLFIVASTTCVTGTFLPGLFFTGTILVSGSTALCFAQVLRTRAQRTVQARGTFATALAASISAARTVKLSGATSSALKHLARLDHVRNDQQRRETKAQVWATSITIVGTGLLPIASWYLYLNGHLSAGAALVTVSTLRSAEWFAWGTANLVSRFPSAQVWTRRSTAMTGLQTYSREVPGVDLVAGTAPAPVPGRRVELRLLELSGFTAVHDDGTCGAQDIDLVVERGQIVVFLGPVGSGKSSLLRALAGLDHHVGTLTWNDTVITEPEHFLRPPQIGYVAQLPRVLSGTVAENVRLGHPYDPSPALTTAQLDEDLAATGTELRIGHKGTRLSGGQVVRLALARALACDPELLIADDVTSALDVVTEAELWKALRRRKRTVICATSRRIALEQADQVAVLLEGKIADRGTWDQLRGNWGHLTG